MSARQTVARGLERATILDRILWLRARLGHRSLAVLTYHRVGTLKDAGELDPGVFEATPEELKEQLDVLRARATVVSLGDVRLACRGKRLPPNPVLVTFDDGYVDFQTRAVPVLRRAGVPATCFVPTAFPDAGKLFWWDRIWLLMHRSPRDRVDLAYPSPLTVHPRRSPPAAAGAIIEAVKHARRVDLAQLWDALEEAAGVALDAAEERALAARTILGWRAIKGLLDAGMDVQSHSHEHVVLNSLAPEAAQRDLARSARVIEDALGEAPYAVAYPVGYALSGALRSAPREARFELGFTNGTGLCPPGIGDPFNVPRISMDLGTGLAEFKLRLLLGDGGGQHGPWQPDSVDPPPPRAEGQRAVPHVTASGTAR